MASKDKESKTFEKLKQFFKFNKSGGANFKGRIDFALTNEIEKDLGPETPLNQRMRHIKDLSEAVLNNRLEDSAIAVLWKCLHDLLHPDIPKENRHQVFAFFRCLVQGQYEKLGLMRVHFFRIITSNDLPPEDIGPRLELLVSLTDNGKDILYFEEDIGPFMLNWMSAVVLANKSFEFLSMLVNVIKYNAALIDEYVIKGLVENTCWLSCHSDTKSVLVCLDVLDTVVCYTNLPSESLQGFIAALCRTVSNEPCANSSWKVMRNLLGTHMGHATLYTMCRLMQSPECLEDARLIRGAVFYVNMSLWGAHKVTTLKYTATSVLPSLLHALDCNERLVVYEVILSIQRLVKKYGLELQDPAWDLILNIIEAVISYIESSEAPQAVITSHLHDTLTTIEQLVELGQFSGSVRRVFELIERSSNVRPEASVLRLVGYLATSVVPTRSLWLVKLNALLERYLKGETRTNIRLKVMEVLANVINVNRAAYEDELIERIVLPHLQHVDADTDVAVRKAAADLLVDLCLNCETKRCLELLDILHKIISRPFEQYANDMTTVITESEVADVKTAITGLVKIFTAKMYQLPSGHSVKAYKLLVNHLEAHYQKPAVFEMTSSIRYMIFDCFLHMRANAAGHLGYPGAGPAGLPFSPYLGVDNKEGGCVTPPPMSPAPTAHPPCAVTHLSMSHACKAVITSLKQEKDWKVVQLLLQEVPCVMRNKALILSRHGTDVDLLAAALCSMVSDKSLNLPESMRNTPPKFTRSEFHAFVFPVLASLASYHAYLEPSLQQRLIKCMEVGLNSRQCAKCVVALTTCILEMRDAMYKLLPEVLLNLSKISATTYIAVPILEFLSTLTRLPKVFASFVGDQYMSVFAISLPYTNPFKYNHYTVSLAHHVIAVWFLKCRLPFRRDLVKYITTGLKANVLVPFEEGQLMKTEMINEDSSNRKRASSLTEQGSRRQLKPLTAARMEGRTGDPKPKMDEALVTFHVELTETCVDLMARYTFNTCSALPKRHATAEFLLSGGQSMTWLLGNKLVTVTTSGCSQKPLKNGLCDKCWASCKADRPGEPTSPEADPESREPSRRAKIAAQRAASIDAAPPPKEGPGLPSKEEGGVPHRLTNQLSIDINPRATPTPTTTSSLAASPVDEGLKSLAQSEPEPSRLDQLLFGSKAPEREDRNHCACWCQGWAEIYVRRPTGDMSWVMRIQNPTSFTNSPADFPLADVSTLFLPSLAQRSTVPREDPTEPRRDSRVLGDPLPESEYDLILEQHFETGAAVAAAATTGNAASAPIAVPGAERMTDDDAEYADADGKSRNPVRRSNSSPEMSANWKNPFLKEKKDGKADTGSDELESKKAGGKPAYKDPRVSCEAIPEEISGMGTTPPACAGPAPTASLTVDVSNCAPPSYLSVHSCPGPDTNAGAKTAGGGPAKTGIGAEAAGHGITAAVSESQVSAAASTLLSPVTVLRTPVGAAAVTARPPQSPKLQQKTAPATPASASPLTVSSANTSPADKIREEAAKMDPSTLSPLTFRDRGHTISVMSPVRKPRIDWSQMRRDNSPRAKEGPRSGINPSYVFLQLYHNAHFQSNADRPVLLSQSDMVQRSIKILDHIPPYETHKVGVLYVGPGQSSNEAEILRNQFGSLRYAQFLQRLGTLIKLDDAEQNTYLGGLHKDGNDGKFAYIWQDDVMQVTFHVATLMPTKESDPLCNSKKLHIGNDYVTIVYNESGEEYAIQTVKGQFNYACVIIQPLDHSTNQVTVKTREELSDHVGHAEPKIVSDQNLAILTRQLALHANLASMISCSLQAKGQDPYASNWLERLRQIKRLRAKVMHETSAADAADDNVTSPRSSRRVHMDDFTEYT